MRGRSRDEVPTAPDPSHAHDRAEPTERPGVWETGNAIARGATSTDALLAILLVHVGERGAILQLVQELLGNTAAAELEAAYLAAIPPDPVTVLLAWRPSEPSGDRGLAAWLLQAAELGWVDATGETRRHLRAYVADARTVESIEKMPGAGYDRGVKPKRDLGNGQGVYDVKLGEAPILDTLHALVRNHIEERYAARRYHADPLFNLGTMLRRDPGYGGSRHTEGAAIDLGGMNFESVKDVMHVLELLPEGRVSRVFPDNDNHLHLAMNGGELELGLPFQGDFFPDRHNLEDGKRRAEAGASPDDTTLHAEGLAWGSTVVNQASATRASGGWRWTKPAPKSGGRAAVSFLASDELRAKLADMMKP